MKDSISLIHKAVFENKPWAITQFYTFSINTSNTIRSIRKPILKCIPKSNKMNNTLLINGLYLYNQLNDDHKFENPKLLCKYFNKYISNVFPCGRLVHCEPGKIYLFLLYCTLFFSFLHYDVQHLSSLW